MMMMLIVMTASMVLSCDGNWRLRIALICLAIENNHGNEWLTLVMTVTIHDDCKSINDYKSITINHDADDDDDDNLSNFCEREEAISVDINCFPKLLASLVVLLDIFSS